MGVFAILSIYIREMFFSVLAMLGIDKSSGNYMQFIYIGLTILSILVFLYQTVFKLDITKREIGLLFAFAMLLLSFLFLPRLLYRNLGDGYQPILLTAFSSVLSAFLMGMVSKRGNFINEMGRAVPWFVLINTVSTSIVAFNPNDQTSTGFIKDSSGFNYQDLSYFIAITFALNVFYIKNQHNIDGKSIFKRPGWNTFFQCLIPIHMLTLFLAGGRGAFLLMCLLTVYYFVMDASNFKKNFKNFLLMSVVVLVVFFVVTSLNIEHSGFKRILGLLEGSGDNNRESTWTRALNMFVNRPLLGYGAGSVFPVMKWYTHNVFLDVLVEYGAVGFIIVIVIVVNLIKKLKLLVQDNPVNHLIVLIFACCATMLLFSGYYLASPSLWFVIGYSFSEVSYRKTQKAHFQIRKNP